MAMMKAMDQLTAHAGPNPHVDILRGQSRAMLGNPLLRVLMGELGKQGAAPEPPEMD